MQDKSALFSNSRIYLTLEVGRVFLQCFIMQCNSNVTATLDRNVDESHKQIGSNTQRRDIVKDASKNKHGGYNSVTCKRCSSCRYNSRSFLCYCSDDISPLTVLSGARQSVTLGRNAPTDRFIKLELTAKLRSNLQ